MRCPQCDTENDPDAKFCKRCGTALTRSCPSCGSGAPEDAGFCPTCGHPLVPALATESPDDRLRQYIPEALLAKLRATGPTVRGERRTVTMLFCDVQGSTAAAEKLDPEEWAEIINGAYEHLIRAVYRYEGTLARLMGDAILAFFGAPIAHEDDAERAILAGLDMLASMHSYAEQVRRKWGIEFAVRVGINTGLVVVGEMGSDLRVEYTAMGDAVNVAARMEQGALPGTIQISEHTHRLVAKLFDFEDLGAVEVKGKRDPVHSYRVLAPKAERGMLRGIDGLHSELVGREREMAEVLAIVEGLRLGRGHVCSVVGEAGMGKSRLVAELKVSTDAADLCWVEGRSLSYESAIPYTPVARVLDACFGSPANGASRYDQIRDHVVGLVPEAVDELVPYLCTVVGVELSGDALDRVRFMDPPVLRGRVLEAVAVYFDRLAAVRPVVAVFEDLHWADSASLDLLERLLSVTDAASLLVLGVFRPDRDLPGWRFHETAARELGHRYTTIDLGALADDDARSLVGNLLAIEGLPDAVRELILEKAEGNPFFVEEVIRSLIDGGAVVESDGVWRATREIHDVAVPDTLSSVLTTRLDHLDEEAKLVAFSASVVGREFDLTTLSKIVDGAPDLPAALATLQRRDLVREIARLPEPRYAFKHALTQQTAYEAALLSMRRRLHLRLADMLEVDAPDRVHDVAHHLVEAGENHRALPYLVEAGRQSFASFSVPEAIRAFTLALDLFDEDDPVELGRRAHEGLGTALAFSNSVPAAMQTYDRMLHLGRARANGPTQASAFNKMGFTSTAMLGDPQQARDYLEKAKALAEECGDPHGIAEYHVNSCVLHTSLGELETAKLHQLEAARVAPEIDEDLSASFHMAYGLAQYANSLLFLTRYDEVPAAIEEAQEFTERSGQLPFLAQVIGISKPLLAIRDGRIDDALEGAKEGLALATRVGATLQEIMVAQWGSHVAGLAGDWASAHSFAEHARDAAVRFGSPLMMVMPFAVLADAEEALGRETALVDELDARVVELVDGPLGEAFASLAFGSLGARALRRGDVDGAARHFTHGADAESALVNLARPDLLIGSGLVALARDDLEEAARLLGEAEAYAADRGMRHVLPSLALAWGRLLHAQGSGPEAELRLRSGVEQASAMSMRPVAVDLHVAAAEVLDALGRAEEAEHERRSARAVVDEMAVLITDVDRRAGFLRVQADRLGLATA